MQIKATVGYSYSLDQTLCLKGAISSVKLAIFDEWFFIVLSEHFEMVRQYVLSSFFLLHKALWPFESHLPKKIAFSKKNK